MRTARIKAPHSFPVAYYHCTSRIVNKDPVLGVREKERFRTYMRHYEHFCGVQVITYCILSNHFHILLEVPTPPSAPLSDSDFLERLQGLKDSVWARTTRDQFQRFLDAAQPEAAQALKQRVYRLMWDVSAYMKLLKQRFSQYFNKLHDRKGTLWEERFGSVLVEGVGTVLQTMAAYIDLNPIRAGIVKDPKEYRWSGYGEAVAGGREAQEGLEKVMGEKGLEGYRSCMYCYGVMDAGLTEEGKPKRLGFTVEEVKGVLAAKGRLPVWEYVRLRVSYFAQGKVLGTQGFVEERWKDYRQKNGLVRKSEGARAMVGVEGDLFSFQGPQYAPTG
jgi:putative transposase